MDTTAFDPRDYLSAVNRRKWWLILPLLACVSAGVALARWLPKEYESSATVAVSSPGVSAQLIQSSTAMDREERVRAINQQLFSRPVLERVAREEHLATGGDMEGLVSRLRHGTRVALPESAIARGEERSSLDRFQITYTDVTPDRTQRIANRLATVFVDEHSKGRAARAEGTSAFLGQQLQESQGRLRDLEVRLRRSKESFMGRLPEQTSANLQMVGGLRQQLDSTATGLRGEQDRLSMIERQIEQLRMGAADATLSRGTPSPSTAQARVTELQRQLTETRAMYTDKHPEIQRIQDELGSARAELAAERQRPTEDRMATLQTDPTYRQLVADRENARLRVRQLQRIESETRGQIGMYQSRVESAPMVEQELTAVNREYELEKTQYGQLSAKFQAAQVAEDLERKQGSEQFRVLYAAFLPKDPVRPNRPRILLLALLAGVVLGTGLAAAREYLDRSVHDVRALQQEFELPVLGEIPRIEKLA